MARCSGLTGSDRTLYLSVSTLALLMPQLALAQVASAPDANALQSPPPAVETPSPSGQARDTASEPPQAASDGAILDIVVTAQRRSERLQDIPAAIAALNGGQLATAGVIKTQDLQLVVPALFFTQTSFSPAPTIRGIGSRGTNPGDEQVVPTYLDGVYQPFITGAIFELSNVERIEVLKGPQGTLLGRNATGGAINIITPTPTNEFEFRGTVGYGSFKEREASFYVAGGTGPISGSIDAKYLQDDGYVRDLTHGGFTGALNSRQVRGKLVLRPGPNTDIILTASYSDRDDTTASATYAYNGNAIVRRLFPTALFSTGGRTTYHSAGYEPFLTIAQRAASATVKQRFGFAELTSISGYAFNKLSYDIDVDISTADFFRQRVVLPDRSFVQELYLTSSNEGPFTWTVGAFYFNDAAGFRPRLVNASTYRSTVTTDAYAAYLQASYKLTDALTVTGGGRYNIDNRTFTASGTNPVGSVPLTRVVFKKFTPSATIDYRASSSLLLYAKYSTAFKSGLFNSSGFSPVPVQPETVKSYELGVKSDPAPWLRLNVAGYYTDYTNIQVQIRDPITTSSLLQNAAAARIYGIEGDATIRLADRLTVSGGLSILKSEYVSFVNAQALIPIPGGGNAAGTLDNTGNRLARVPSVTGSTSVNYAIPVSFGTISVNANAAYTGDFYWAADKRLQQDDYVTINAQLGWKSLNGRYGVTLWGRNLTDNSPPLTISPNANSDSTAYVRPRSVGIRLSVER